MPERWSPVPINPIVTRYDPEGKLPAPVGAEVLNIETGARWVKTTGSGAHGWAQATGRKP